VLHGTQARGKRQEAKGNSKGKRQEAKGNSKGKRQEATAKARGKRHGARHSVHTPQPETHVATTLIMMYFY
jgi:hypothetical protein